MAAPQPHAAAAIILNTPDGALLVGERAATLPFMPRYVSVPGGKVEDDDHRVATVLWPTEPHGVRKAAALRELREECAVVVTDRGAIAEPTELRDVPLDAALRQLGASLDPSRIEPAGRWVTPSYSPVRFDTSFFYARIPESVPVNASSELAWAEFRSGAALWQQYIDLDLLLPPPFRAALELLRFNPDDAAGRLRIVPGARGEYHPDFEPISGIRQIPLRTPTLPPATHTNAYIVGHEQLIVVDPAPYDRDERETLRFVVQSLLDAGATFDSVVLTHHHSDHMGAAQWLAEAYGVPVRAHPITRDLLEGQVRVDTLLNEGDRIELGADRSGQPFTLDVLFTPGHAPGHIVLADRRRNATSMIVGDMVASIGSIIIDPPEGNMAVYIEQLRRLRARPCGVLFPAHGAPVVDGHAKLDQYVKHRLHREEKVDAALRTVGRSEPVDLLALAYDDTPPHLYPLAARACLAHLEKLVTDGRAHRDGETFSPVGATL